MKGQNYIISNNSPCHYFGGWQSKEIQPERPVIGTWWHHPVIPEAKSEGSRDQEFKAILSECRSRGCQGE